MNNMTKVELRVERLKQYLPTDDFITYQGDGFYLIKADENHIAYAGKGFVNDLLSTIEERFKNNK